MNKSVLSIAIVAAAIAAGAGSVKFTADQVDSQLLAGVEAFNANPAYRDQVELQLDPAQQERGWLASDYRLALVLKKPDADIQALLGGDRIPLRLSSEHRPFSATLTATLADSALLQRLTELQQTPGRVPFNSVLNVDFNPLSQSARMELNVDSDAFSFSEEGQSMEIGALSLQGELDGQAVTLAMQLAPVKVKDSQGNGLELAGMKLNYQGQLQAGSTLSEGSYQQFDSELTLMPFSVRDGGTRVSLERFGIVTRQRREGQRVLLDTSYRADGPRHFDPATKRETQFSQATLGLTLDLDSAGFDNAMARLQALSRQAELQPQQLVDLLNPITSQGVRLRLNELSLAGDSPMLNAQGELSLSSFNVNELEAGPRTLAEKAAAELSLSADPVVLSRLAGARWQRDLSRLQAQGFVTVVDEKLHSKLEFKDRALLVNGQTLMRF
ncbi:DUF945 family protein [Marinobacterium arenosum]|uniref:DUF945 family protein n=1 Tax=Marinobacterium arenosum TaxID=2862496 RepID=UPI001C97B3FA|nr:DUF945 family protein [Marinobacterium arenosum]MBY4676974.1 YdgA family protein [Marinobacterium arenosum]